jgi:type VI secretion system secreted protein Hcp
MAFDAFINIDDIEGESTDDQHPGWIEVLDCSVGLKQKVSKTASSADGASAERAEFNDFNFTKEIDAASPHSACLRQRHPHRYHYSPILPGRNAEGQIHDI